MSRRETPYSKVVRSTWGDDKFKHLSPLRPSGQALWIYLLTGPHCTVIPGLFPRMGIGTLADALKWTPVQVGRAWSEIESAAMAESDWNAGVIWLPNAIAYNDPASPNVVTAWRSVPLPQCELVTRALRSLRVYLASKEKPSWAEAFDEVFAKAFPEVFGHTGSGSGSGLSPLPPVNGGPVQTVENSRAVIRVVRQDRNEAKLIRTNAGRCPHGDTCETYSICIEHLATTIAIRRYEARLRAS